MLRRPGVLERGYVVLTLFLLAYSLPTTWFVRSGVGGGEGGGGALDSAVFAALLGSSLVPLLLLKGPALARILRLDGAVLVLLALLFLSALWSYDVGFSLRRAVALVLTTAFAYYLVQRFPLVDIVALAGVALAMGVVLNYLWIFGLAAIGDSPAGWTGLLSHKNTLGRIAVLGALTHVLLIRMRPGARLWHLTFTFANVGLVAGSRSTTAAVSTMSLALSLVVFTTFRARRTLFGAVLVSLTTASVVGALAATNQFAAITNALGKDVTLTGRTVLWGEAIKAIGRRPLLGYGYEGFWGDGKGWWTPAHEIWIRTGWDPPHSHNGLLEMLLTAGLVGAMLLLYVMVRAVLRAVIYLRATPGPLGLWPLSFLSYVVLVSITERGIVGRSLNWVLFVVAVLVVAERSRHRGSAAPGPEGEGLLPAMQHEQSAPPVLPRQLVP